ncbi:leukocyte elastase inhibitor-like isoform X3 [Schistocerca cancellata]|uniref:leukocyte elastase inhibitor-like isoform X3 n=1 Tax=Schistocerca cancellata TaxID=274614 RepID=UPI0021195438|nr:leukocyte elastase inhibitor-like isoform X3 [Schistocerca cancellata]
MAEEVNVALHNISQANNVFTFDMYKILAAEPGNLFFSPISIQVILALTFLGAKGNTAKQIARGLRLPEDTTVVEDGVGAIMNRLQDNNDVLLDIANRIFLKAGYGIKDGFNQSATRFKAGIEEVDFLQEPQARKTINDWVEKKTNNKIKDIIPPGILNDLTRMVLVNAIYFKGDWLKKFEEDRTLPLPFHSAVGQSKNVDMMFLEEEFKYTEINDLNCQALLLPYKGERLNMMILLPREVNGLASLEAKLADFSLQDTVNNMYRTNVYVYLPKFKMEYSKELTGPLTGLGMIDMFDDFASNFSGITDEERLKVDKVLHKAFVEVNEKGTEAAAATAVIIGYPTSVGFGPPPPIIFKADHPFLFLILDQQTKTVLFAGRYSEPPSTS